MPSAAARISISDIYMSLFRRISLRRQRGFLEGYEPFRGPWRVYTRDCRNWLIVSAARWLHCGANFLGGSIDENSCPRRGHRRRRGRRQHALSPREKRLVGRGAARALRAHRRLDLARRGPPAALQYELHGRAAAQVLGRSLQAPARGDRTGRELPRHRESAPRDLPRPHGRVSEVLRHRQHHRRAVPDHLARRR